MRRTMRLCAWLPPLVSIAACVPMPPASLPEVSVAATFKEAPTAQGASEAALAGRWWTLFGDAELDALQQRLSDNSPDLAAALARYGQARAASDLLRAAQVPSIGASLDVQRDRQAQLRPLRVLGPGSPDNYTSATLALDVSYEVDLWGRVRQRVEAGAAEARAARADLAGARLALRAQLADTWIALRGLDAEVALLRETEASYSRAAELIGHRYQAGTASGLDLARAQTQLDSTRSQLRQALAQRAVLEHAVATLVGANASAFASEPSVVAAVVPAIPVGLPSTLLQRRPDIVAAQERVASANASVGVARAAFFPSLTLAAQGGFQTSDLARFIEAPNLFWAVGSGLAATLFDGGRRQADIARAKAVLDEAGQRYRGTVLAAFQQVEDQLALLARYGEAAADERSAVAASQRTLDLATNRYRDGMASYLDVVTAQTANLQARRNELDLVTRQRRATVQLVRAIGGGWLAGGDGDV
ncbi:efflux transporter outer membrane subunit (plasmid) [Ralstonia syzygii]|uniref:Efflux transporter outer membrane subunit n=1 Tax=Ralstonia syzygii TaxID=28097 RepID=A0ABX7ZL40_9RALS|nr:efflux transporter outer membrane subunit [Ralstonia syzygii]QUP56037.1 efflux transporter outer membrane subunit [Ralstonia syzygii]